MSIAFNAWTVALLAAAALSAILAIVSLARVRARGWTVDALLGACVVIFLAVLFAGTREGGAAPRVADVPPVEAAALPRSTSSGTCSSLEVGDAASRAKDTLGKPDRVEPAAQIRGPGAEIWRYEGRCAVHVFEGKIEFIE